MATQPISNLVTTWNAAGTTFTAIKMNVTDTASAAASRLMDLQVGGSSRFSVSKLGRVDFANAMVGGTNSAYYARNDSAIYALGSSDDVVLNRDAANTLAQRNSTNAQTFRVYKSYTDGSNYSRVALYASGGGNFVLSSEIAGTGTGGIFYISNAGANAIEFQTNAASRWTISGSNGHFLAGTDNTHDIGASGANRPRNVYVAGAVTAGSSFECGSGDGFVITSRAIIRSFANGTIQISNAASNDFGRLQFGGTTSSFPALKRNGTALDVRLADDSNFASLNAGQIYATAGSALIADGYVKAQHTTAIPAGGTAGAGLMVSSTANFGVFFGSGAPTLSAAKGSLYLRSDGTTTNDRAYINTNGSTTWTALTTAA